MADPSQSEIDRQTIAAFEELWRKTVISETSDSVKASVAKALEELTKPAGEIAQHAKELGSLGQQVSQVIAQSKAATDEVSKVAQLAPDLTRDLGLLREQVDELLRTLSKEQGWRSRLEKWQQDSKLRDTLVALAAMPKDQEQGVAADGDDREAEPDQAESQGKGQSVFLETSQASGPTDSISGSDSPAATAKDRWQKLALAAAAAGLVGLVVGVGLGKAQQDAPQAAGTARSGSAASAALPDQTELVDRQWKYLRESDTHKARFAGYCNGPCETAAAGSAASFEAVWRSQSPPRQQQLFRDLVAATEAQPLPQAQCKTLLARANLFDSAPEFTPQIAGCMVQQKFDRGGQAFKAEELLAAAQRLLAFKQESYLASREEPAEAAAPVAAPSSAPTPQPTPASNRAQPAQDAPPVPQPSPSAAGPNG